MAEAQFIKHDEKLVIWYSQKENDNSPVTKLKGTGYCNLTYKEFKIAVMMKFNELQVNSERQFDELRNKMSKQKEFFTREIEILKKNQILELKNSMNDMKNTLESLRNRADQTEERISNLEDRNLEMTQE